MDKTERLAVAIMARFEPGCALLILTLTFNLRRPGADRAVIEQFA